MRLKFFSKKFKKPETILEYMRLEGIGTQRALAERLDISESTISRFLSGIRPFSRREALRIHKLTGVPIEHLITLQELRQ